MGQLLTRTLQEHDPEVVVGFHVGRNELGRFGVAAYSLYQTTLHRANEQHQVACSTGTTINRAPLSDGLSFFSGQGSCFFVPRPLSAVRCVGMLETAC